MYHNCQKEREETEHGCVRLNTIVKLGTVTASAMGMHASRVNYIDLDLHSWSHRS